MRHSGWSNAVAAGLRQFRLAQLCRRCGASAHNQSAFISGIFYASQPLSVCPMLSECVSNTRRLRRRRRRHRRLCRSGAHNFDYSFECLSCALLSQRGGEYARRTCGTLRTFYAPRRVRSGGGAKPVLHNLIHRQRAYARTEPKHHHHHYHHHHHIFIAIFKETHVTNERNNQPTTTARRRSVPGLKRIKRTVIITRAVAAAETCRALTG